MGEQQLRRAVDRRRVLAGLGAAGAAAEPVFNLNRLDHGKHTLTVEAVDEASFVRNPGYRQEALTDSVTWTIRG